MPDYNQMTPINRLPFLTEALKSDAIPKDDDGTTTRAHLASAGRSH